MSLPRSGAFDATIFEATMDTEKRLQEALADLGDTEAEAVQFLTDAGLRGDPEMCEGCILAEWLRGAGFSNVEVHPALSTKHRWVTADGVTVDLPDHLNTLALRFDDWKYRDLVDWRCPGCGCKTFGWITRDGVPAYCVDCCKSGGAPLRTDGADV